LSSEATASELEKLLTGAAAALERGDIAQAQTILEQAGQWVSTATASGTKLKRSELDSLRSAFARGESSAAAAQKKLAQSMNEAAQLGRAAQAYRNTSDFGDER
jgi:hypothetical protein